MAKTKPIAIKSENVPGGVRLTGMGRSDRGTRYLSGSITLLQGDQSKEVYQGKIAVAIQQIMGDQLSVG